MISDQLSVKTVENEGEIEPRDIRTLSETKSRGKACLRLIEGGLPMGDYQDRPYTVRQSFGV